MGTLVKYKYLKPVLVYSTRVTACCFYVVSSSRCSQEWVVFVVCWSRTSDLRWIVWRAAASRASIVLLNQDWAIFPGNIGEQHYTPVLRGVCGGHVSTDCFKMKDTFSVGDTFKHTQNPAGSPKIVFSSVCPKGTAALHLMRTLCGWTGQHRNTGLLHVLMAPQEFACTIFKCIWSLLSLPKASKSLCDRCGVCDDEFISHRSF